MHAASLQPTRVLQEKAYLKPLFPQLCADLQEWPEYWGQVLGRLQLLPMPTGVMSELYCNLHIKPWTPDCMAWHHGEPCLNHWTQFACRTHALFFIVMSSQYTADVGSGLMCGWISYSGDWLDQFGLLFVQNVSVSLQE